MNILSELLPGARQIRTPLAIGYLWFLVAWINVVHIPVTIRHGLLITRASQDFKHLNLALVILIVSFMAYLVGLFFEVLDDIAVKAGVALAVFAIIAGISAAIGVLSIAFWPITLAVLTVISLVFYLRARRLSTEIDAEFTQFIANIYLPIRQYCYRLKNTALRVWSTANPVRDDLVADSVVKLLDQHTEMTEKFCETLSIDRLRVACYEAGLRANRISSQAINLDGAAVNIGKAIRRSSVDPESEKLLRSYLAQRLAASREIRRSVVLRVMNTSDVRHLVDRAVEDVTARIQADKPTVFEIYDRLQSEGELRRGASVPLGVALASACFTYTNNRWFIFGAAIPAIFIYFSGMKKQEEATRIVVNCITAQIVPIDLEINDVRLLQWPTREPLRKAKIVSMIRSLTKLGRNSNTSALESDVNAAKKEGEAGARFDA